MWKVVTRGALLVLTLTLGITLFAPPVLAQLREVRLDYATYSPLSLIIKHFGWAEEEFAHDGIAVRWVFSLGSSVANENLRSRAVDFASTAGAAALNARAQGVPLKVVYILQQPEWTALVVRAGSGITRVEDLKGKRIAALLGTDPWFFALRTLEAHGLSTRDVTIVNIPHPEGRIALQRGDVDAWAGLDPHMADAQLTSGDILLYRNLDFNTYGTLNVLESFLQQYPDIVERVLGLYERARLWALEHPEETTQILAEYAQMDLEVARLQMEERVHFIDPVPGEEVYAALEAIIPLLLEIPNNLPRRADPWQALATLFHTETAAKVVARAAGGAE
ncbi:MAG: aliphatic sulfonate ABC transporter substrate-binding protein [Firmicutes bacterium]|nr:aliphatic sulfonate ABC transporter substrate-binding protein [Bacillota bacterium]